MMAWDHTPWLTGLLTPGFPYSYNSYFWNMMWLFQKQAQFFLGVVTHNLAFPVRKLANPLGDAVGMIATVS